jgi:hypothetical protein
VFSRAIEGRIVSCCIMSVPSYHPLSRVT